MKCLILDDQKIFQSLFADACEKAGIDTVYKASTVNDAIRIYYNKRPDLIVADVELKNQESGLEFVSIVLSLPERPKVLICSAHEEDAVVRAIAALGIEGYINKEQALDDLSEALKVISNGGTIWRSEKNPFYKPGWEQAFTKAELEALLLIGHWKDNREGSQFLQISEESFRKRRNAIENRLRRPGPKLFEWLNKHGFQFVPITK